MTMRIRNPLEWGADQVKAGLRSVSSARHAIYRPGEDRNALLPAICRIRVADLREILAKGLADFAAYRTDVLFLCLIYPVGGLILAWAVFGRDLVQLLFPLASGFALLGPFAAVGLYEMSRRREHGESITWMDAFEVLRSPAFGAILVLGLVLMVIFLLWLVSAQAIYAGTLGPGPESPASFSAFLRDVFTTDAGWTLILVGVGVGFLFAVLVLAISVVSFPLLLDRKVGVVTAVWTSIRVVRANPVPIALWGLIVVAGLVIGSLPLFVGLAIVMPVLGHATWHLYRKAVAH